MSLEGLLEAVDIVELASKFTDLTESNGEFWGISPITSPPERTPSFSVRRETGKFYDFSSGVGGTAITLVQYCMRVSKAEAIEWLKNYVCYDGGTADHPTISAIEVARKYAPPKKRQSQEASTVLPDDYMARFERPDDKLSVWEQEGISRGSLDKFQVCYDRFSNRLVYPIRNPDGKIVNVGGRTLDSDWKEHRVRKYTYYHQWGEVRTIYGLFENVQSILSKHEIILFEGAKSVLLADTWGIHNTGAILTSHLNPNQLDLLIRLQCKVVFALDKDVDVRSDHNIDKLKHFVNASYIWDKGDLLSDKDSPVDKGKEVWDYLYSERLALR